MYLILFIFVYVSVHVHSVIRRGIGSPVAEVAGDCEPSRRILGTELGSFEETEALLTAKPLVF